MLSEVPAGVSIDECKQLVAACEASSGVYMMAENCVYTRPNQIVKAMIEVFPGKVQLGGGLRDLEAIEDFIGNPLPSRR